MNEVGVDPIFLSLFLLINCKHTIFRLIYSCFLWKIKFAFFLSVFFGFLRNFWANCDSSINDVTFLGEGASRIFDMPYQKYMKMRDIEEGVKNPIFLVTSFTDEPLLNALDFKNLDRKKFIGFSNV